MSTPDTVYKPSQCQDACFYGDTNPERFGHGHGDRNVAKPGTVHTGPVRMKVPVSMATLIESSRSVRDPGATKIRRLL